ncbi:hypothetical protein ABZ366_07220 [Streptomyces sp. NPDC005904]|uniref:hypothetical protein n=1 Tax=Streptomyces sp. NPDC005904 TaxID=3154570 RepID=UPI0033D3BDA4
MPSASDPARRRVLIAPVPIAPTKPLTLSHVKGLLWSDVLHRATALLYPTDHLYSWTVGVDNAQTHGFWAHLEATRPGQDFTAFDEEKIGELYVDYQRGRASDPARPGPVDATGTLHPASARVLDLWTDRYRELGIADPGLRVPTVPPMTVDALVELLSRHGLCLDHRPWNGPAYLDGTARGLPLRRLVGADGRGNYLAGVLRELVPLIGAYDDFVLPCDTGSLPDYVLVRHVLRVLGARVTVLGVGRVRTGGTATGPPRSSRHGGWQGRTAAALAERFLDRVGPRVHRLGTRLYFIALLGRGDREPYRPDLLGRCMARAARLLAEEDGGPGAPTAPEALAPLLRRHARPHPYVDPYRLTTALLTRDRTPAHRTLLEKVYV